MDSSEEKLKQELEEVTSLLKTYMILCDEQSTTIETMAKVIHQQSMRIREMQEVHGFIDM
ncbi:MAG: hypothetical protein IKD59_04670 [Lachnospiraceae bacterium]|jgi:hypothetical protein|nr:hypothetical protein [Blautia sp.]MBR2653830.1 hypothetical protein [Lachnospiraceae bacterium]